MPSVYFDSGAFDHLYGKIGCSAADIADLRKKIYGRELSIALSIQTLAEILLDPRARPEHRVAKTKFVLSIGNFRRMIKPAGRLLLDDIRSYAAAGEAARPYLDTQLQNVLSDGIGGLIETDGEELDDDMMDALRDAMGAASAASAPVIDHRGALDFTEYSEKTSPRLLEAYAGEAGVLTACRARGLAGLAALPSVAIALSLSIWSAYHQRSLDSSHAVCAATSADLIVTPDETVRRALTDKLPCASLTDFLQNRGWAES